MDIEAKLTEARAKAKELWERLRAVEEEIKPHVERCEEARHAWYVAQQRAEVCEAMIKETHEH